MLRIAIGLALLVLATRAPAFDGERPALPEDYGLPGDTGYQQVRCVTTPGTPLNAMAYVRASSGGGIEILSFCLHDFADWLAPQQDPRLYQFHQCWMRPPTDGQGRLSTASWCHDKVMPDGRVLPPAGTGQFYAWFDARGQLQYFCDMSCHYPGDQD